MQDIRTKSKKQEKRVAKEIGGKVQVASGAMWHSKADVRLDKFLIECKTTEKPFYSLTLKVWDKIAQEALRDGMRAPLMQIDLEDGKSSVCVISYDDFLEFSKEEYMRNPVFTVRMDYLKGNAKSFRVKADFTKDPMRYENQLFNRHDVQFYGGLHLVILKWSDFPLILKSED